MIKQKTKNAEILKKDIIAKLDDLKTKDIISIDIRKVSSLADYIIIATGTSSKHIDATATNLRAFLKTKEQGGFKPDGVAEGGWVALDLGNIIVHLFTKEVRETYNLENLWKKLRK
jgi:ribosome-associated protein